MIAPWVVYCIGLGALFALAAVGLEYVARAGHWPVRWIWLLGVLATVIVPVGINEFAVPKAHEPLALSTSPLFEPELPAGTTDSRAALDGPLLALWFLTSLAIAGRIAATAVSLRRSRDRWHDITLDGESVLLSAELGPAVIGLTRRRTVMPKWTLTLDATSRALILHHEREHARAGDPLLLAGAAVALVAMPWNPVLWFLVRRLRLAIEMDCDARVLASGANPRTYASLLLAVGERMSRTPFAWAIALATPRSLLERRIVAMTSPFRPRYPRLAVAAIGAGVVLTLAIACGTEHPDPVMVSTRPVATPEKAVSTAPPERTATAPLRKHMAGVPDTLRYDLRYVEPGVLPRPIHAGGKEVLAPGVSAATADARSAYYNSRPVRVRYPDGYEVVVDSLAAVHTLLSADKPWAHAASASSPARTAEDSTARRHAEIVYRSWDSPHEASLQVGEKLCAVQGKGDANRGRSGSGVKVGDTLCVYRGRGD